MEKKKAILLLRIKAHPVWEELILIKNSDAELEKIDGYLKNL
jgi:hypothetical protein